MPAVCNAAFIHLAVKLIIGARALIVEGPVVSLTIKLPEELPNLVRAVL